VIYLSFWGSILAGVAIGWSVNLYNFMDGIDGLAALEAIFVFGVGGYLIWHAGGYAFAMLAWVLVVLILGFLVWNFPPAKIFMGDIGSAFLGCLVVIFALIGEIQYKVPGLLWLMLYGVFVFDATLTLLKRMVSGKKWYLAHRTHAYQRLQDCNWSHARILAHIFVVNVILAALTLYAYIYQEYLLILLCVALVVLSVAYLSVFILVSRNEKN